MNTTSSNNTAPRVNEMDRQRAREIAHLFGGNGLTMNQSLELAAAKLAEHREDPLGLTSPLQGWLTDGRAAEIAEGALTNRKPLARFASA